MAKTKKKILGLIKLQIPAGKANPSPPVGPALGQKGLNIMEFCKAFNAATQKMEPGIAGQITLAQVKEIAEAKMPDLNCSTVEAAMNMVKGQAISMGVKVTE